MELFVRDRNSGKWRPTTGLLSGLKVAAQESSEVALRSDDPADELDEIIACIWFFKLASGSAGELSLISRCPSSSWVDMVRGAGVERVFAQGHRAETRSLDGLLEVPRDICPELHVRGARGSALSVCGKRSDRMVLAAHHFASRCFSQWKSCDIANWEGGGP